MRGEMCIWIFAVWFPYFILYMFLILKLKLQCWWSDGMISGEWMWMKTLF